MVHSGYTRAALAVLVGLVVSACNRSTHVYVPSRNTDILSLLVRMIIQPAERLRTAASLLLPIVFVVPTSLFAQNPKEPAAAIQPAESAKGTVQGQVVEAATGEPLKGARVVVIRRSEEPQEGPEAITDSNGRFVINVAAGAYHFRASKLGYLEQAYHPDPSGPAQLLRLAPGDKVDKVLFRLGRAAVITGRITDEAGEPLIGVEVAVLAPRRLMDYNVLTSTERMSLFQTVLTNDLGEYRAYNLPPGDYYVAASDTRIYIPSLVGERPPSGLDLAWGFRRHLGDHPMLYYPGVFNASEAQKVRVTSGEEAHINLSVRPAKMVTVSGRVFDLSGRPAYFAFVQLRTPIKLRYEPDKALAAKTDDQGNFEIEKVLPGSYEISASFDSYDKSMNLLTFWAEQQVEVGGDDVSGLQLNLSSDVEVSGRLKTDGVAKLDFGGVTVALEGGEVSLGDGAVTGGYRSHRGVKADGTFTIERVSRTAYSVRVELPDNWYVHSATFGTQNVLENGLELAGENVGHSLEIRVSPGVALINGNVLKGDQRVPGAKVKLIPEPYNPHRQENKRDTVWADENGQFEFKNVAPGSYHVYAVDTETDVENYGDESLASTIVTVTERDTKTVQIKLDKKSD